MRECWGAFVFTRRPGTRFVGLDEMEGAPYILFDYPDEGQVVFPFVLVGEVLGENIPRHRVCVAI